MILPQMEGPFEVDRASSHTCELIDPLTRAPAFQSRPVANSRLVKFDFPAAYVTEGATPSAEEMDLHQGDFVVAARTPGRRSWAQVAMIDATYEVGGQFGVQWYEVPRGERYGPWRRRPWHAAAHAAAGRDVITREEILLKVDLQDDALTADDLAILATFGIAVSEPTRDKVLHFS